MVILTHGSDLTLAPAVEPLVGCVGGKLTTAAGKLRELGFESVQLDATLPGVRPRELDRRARRDLLAALARASVRPAGIDLFIPQRHYTDPAHVDRAMSATLAAMELAADLGKLPLSLALPVKAFPDDVKAALVESADGRGVRLAVHAEDALDQLLQWISTVDLPILGAGLDPAAVLARGGDPVKCVHQLGSRLTVARLCDWSSAQRCVVGRGELDVTQYRIALDLSAKSRTGPVVLDVRGLSEPLSAAASAARTWADAAFTV